MALRLWQLSGEDVLRYGARVRQFIKARVGFVLEFPEQLHRPEWMLGEIAAGRRVYGDCDDMSMLSAALLMVLGIPVRFAAVKPAGDPDYMHVFTEMFFEGDWRMVDCTADQVPPGLWDVLRVEV